MLFLFQLIFFIFSLVALAGVWRRGRIGVLGPEGMWFWILFWFMADVAVWWPNSTTLLANRLGIGRGTDFVLYVSLMIIFYLLFRLHIKVETIGRDVTKVVRRNALDEVPKK